MSLINTFKRYLSGMRTVATKPNQVDLNKLTVIRLKAMAKERGLTGYSRLNKSGLVKLLS